MKITLVAPKSISEGEFRFDYGYWNFYLPLLSMGHDVHFFDTTKLGNKDLKVHIDNFKPELLFCIMTDSPYYCPDEPWETIEEETNKGNIKTFNWFCDDSWRFNNFSSKACHVFNHCSTPEKRFVDKYEEIGYSNIQYAPWHANSEIYSSLPNESIEYNVSFIGALRGDRERAIKVLKSKGHEVYTPTDTSIESMVSTYSSSFASLNFSKNSTNMGTQMKARMFEVPATGSLLITEYTRDLENCYDIGKDIITFSTEDQLLDIIGDMQYYPEKYKNIAKRGYERFLKDHDSKVRLAQVLENIK
mgnify:CR=1 FL=1|tara:strand:+ start:2445 stop:3353 length:909 start_codon:yes stop_codon:yes gene_type:complete